MAKIPADTIGRGDFMQALRTRLEDFVPEPRDTLDDSPGYVLTHLRLAALDCRAAARADFFEACNVLSSDPQIARTAHVETLVRCLPQALRTRPTFHRPGTAELSFDEAWLVRLVRAAGTGDFDSLAFLVRSRVPRRAQRNFTFLLRRIAEQFRPT